jgi:hypothetical protein
MATSKLKDIRAALATQLLTLQTANVPPIAFENENYEPITDTLFLREFLLPVAKNQVGNATSDSDDYIGIYQVNVAVRSGDISQRFTAQTQAAAVEDAFLRDAEFTSGGVTVKIQKTEQAQGLQTNGGAWYEIPISIYYRAFV